LENVAEDNKESIIDKTKDADEVKKQNEEGKVLEEDINEETLEESEIKEDEDFEKIDEENEEKIKEENIALKEEVKKLNNIVNAAQDKYIRMTAEYDNYRKRTSKEKENIYTDSCADILKEFLPVLDNLERAVEADGSLEELRKGVEMTLKQFHDSLTKLNVEEINAEGNFDPNIHNAVMHMESEEYGSNEIAEVFQKGYKRGEKVLRYSMVKVAN
jgi:molecular chaperone GrpE